MATRWTTRNKRLFSGTEQVANFRSMSTIYPVRVIRRSTRPRPFESGTAIALPKSFTYGGASHDTRAFLEKVETTGLLVLKDGKNVYENYWLGNDATTQSVSWSVAKSFVSALMGIAVGDRKIASVLDPVTKYAPELAGSAYDGVRIKDVLQMSSGARWNEDYSNPDADINRFGRMLVEGTSLDAFAATVRPEKPPGTFNRYNTTDTHVLGMVIRNATGQSLSEFLHDRLWDPLGMEADGFWIVDNCGMEMAGGGLNAVLRDYAKLGQLYLNEGNWHGKQLIPAQWIRDSVTPDAPHVMPGTRDSALLPWGYGYQWWVPDNSGAYSAIGIYGQFIFVHPKARVVIAKTTAFRDYAQSTAPEHYRTADHFALFHAIAESTM
ncbi:MAG: serine hydrolase [Alphaproteobacteria bacterium]|nr:serine hydrolase [Alphaproteobacteria bacterium]